jgi:hypothetical protein
MTVQEYYSQHSEKMNLAYWVNENDQDSNHIILHASELVPDIYSIKKIFLTIVLGSIVLQLDDHEERTHLAGNVIAIPNRAKMKIRNLSSDQVAILVLNL